MATTSSVTSTTASSTSTMSSSTTFPPGACTASPLAGAPDNVVGNLNLQQLFQIIGTAFGIITTIATIFFVGWHLTNLTNRHEQKLILRIGLVPFFFTLFAVISLWSYAASIYLSDPGKWWESFAVVALFELFVIFCADPDVDHTKARLFRDLRPRGYDEKLTRKFCIRVFQLPLISTIKLILTIVFTALQCRTSSVHQTCMIVIQVIYTASTIYAVLGVIIFYRKNRDILKPYRGVSKLAALKLCVVIITAQMIIFMGIDSQQSITAGNDTISNADIEQGIPALLIAVMMSIFIFGIIYAYPATPYKRCNMPANKQPHSENHFVLALKTMVDVFNLWDVVRGVLLAAATFVQMRSPNSSLGAHGVKDAHVVGASENKPFPESDSSDENLANPREQPGWAPQRAHYSNADDTTGAFATESTQEQGRMYQQRPSFGQAQGSRPAYSQAEGSRPAY